MGPLETQILGDLEALSLEDEEGGGVFFCPFWDKLIPTWKCPCGLAERK